MKVSGFDWDKWNRDKCQKHGVPIEEIEGIFSGNLVARPDHKHSKSEERRLAIGKTPDGRDVFVCFTIRERDGKKLIRPISARYMHKKEVLSYEEEKENPNV